MLAVADFLWKNLQKHKVMVKKQLKITLVRSTIDRPETQKATVRGLGLRKLHDSVLLEDTQAIRGMVRKVQHLLSVEPASSSSK